MNTVDIQILFFGSLRTYFGSILKYTVPQEITVEEILVLLKEKNEEAIPIIDSCRIAVNENVEELDFKITENATLALLPPFSGG